MSDEMPWSAIRELGWNHHRKASRLDFHRNDGIEITYTLAGDYTWELEDGRCLHSPAGYVGVTQGQTRHRAYHGTLKPGKLFYVVIQFDDPQVHLNAPMGVDDLAKMAQRFYALGDQVTKGSPALKTAVEDFIQSMEDPTVDELSLWRRRIHLAHILVSTLTSFQVEQPDSHHPIVNRVCDYIREHALGQPTVEELALAGGVGRSRLFELFKNTLGISPSEYLQNVKCQMACLALRETSRSITSIAMEHGYSSSQYFSLTVKKYTGYSPREYRKRTRLR